MSLHQIRDIGRNDMLFSVARLPNSENLLVASSAGKVFRVDASQNNATATELANHGRYVTSVRLHGNTVVSAGYDGKILWWDLEGNRLARTTDNAHSRWIRHLAFSPDGSKLASVGDDMVCRIWNAQTGERIRELRGHQQQTPSHFSSMLYVCCFSHDGTKIATGDRIGHVIVWDVNSGEQLSAFDVPVLYTWDGRQRIRSIGGIRGLAFSPNNEHLAVGGVGQIGNVDSLAGPSTVEVFNWRERQRVYRFTGPNGIVNCLRYHPDNRWLCAVGGGGNGLVMIYDPTRRNMLHQGNLPMHTHDVAFNSDHSRLYLAGHNKISVQEIRDS